MRSPDQWNDLRPRLFSAAAMLLVGAVEIWLGGLSFLGLVTLVTAMMIWELARMTAHEERRMALVLAAMAAMALILDEGWPSMSAWLLFPWVVLAVGLTPRKFPLGAAVIATAIMVSGHGLFVLRDEAGTAAILWLLGVVIASDVMGYFAGRMLGGPKFWPAISPKKTWSGTVAGWFGAILVGLGFVLAGYGTWGLLLVSPLIAFAGQMGDIGESWIKRRTGVKDSSHLIPGHGGLMDRFDALTGAMVAVMVLAHIMPLPIGG
jgi:phosphatidate cytidylyltransferase